MDRRTLLARAVFPLAALAVVMVLLVFKVRVAVAGGKYVLALLVILLLTWFISRGLRK